MKRQEGNNFIRITELALKWNLKFENNEIRFSKISATEAVSDLVSLNFVYPFK